jgi:hypothetical protein
MRQSVLSIDTLYRKIGGEAVRAEEGTMTEHPAAGKDDQSGRDGPGVPRWVKIFVILGAVLVAFVVVLLLSGHGPGRHGQAAAGSHGVRW